MRYFPMFLDLARRNVVLAGGGEQIAQKVRLLARTEARLFILSEDLIPELAGLVEAGRAVHVAQDIDAATLSSAHYVFIATEDEELDLEIADHARAGGAVVNVIDRPDECDMITPAIVDRDPVVVAVGTEGAAPVLAKSVKTTVEGLLSADLGPFIAMIGRQRDQVAEEVEAKDRLAFWDWAVRGAPWAAWRAGENEAAVQMIRDAAAMGHAPGAPGGGLTIIEMPEAPDLTPLRAVQRLQNAAVICRPSETDPALMDLARRDAERTEDIGAALARAGEETVVVISSEIEGWPETAEIIRAVRH
ncbi:MAG: precorrin-2 dehydrogenase/sirohydrochlorin ferrochelatase family protein [Pikeienuella sp.]